MAYAYKSAGKSSRPKNRYNAKPRGGAYGGRPRANRNRSKSQYIDPSRFIKTASPVEETKYTALHNFGDFAMDALLLDNITKKGYQYPTPIQDQAVPAGLTGSDIVGVAGTGTGKTTAFMLPVIDKLLRDDASKALVIAPTRELAQQIQKETTVLTKGSNIGDILIVGGTNMNAQIKQLRRQPRIIIGTPGRLMDHVKRGTIKLRATNTVVLDEVDRMLDMGFLPDVTSLLDSVSPERQSFFFSATMERKVMQLIDGFTKEPIKIELQVSRAADNIHQDVIHYSGNGQKLEKLHEALIGDLVSKAIIFEETQRGVDKLHKELQDRGFSSDSIHGGKSLGQRRRALARFKDSDVSILVATDVAARGIDVKDVSHVFNYSLPNVYDDYIHRIGRAGRAGQIGHAFTFVEK